MKIKHLFGLAVIAAMTASCSSNEDLGTAGPGTGTNEAGVGYATFSINLPTTSGTRADANPEFKPGDANEYDVFNATLLVFKKPTAATSEGEYTFVEHVDLGSMQPWKSSSETGVTTQAKITAKLSKVDKSGEYFALVLLNNGSGADAKVNLPTDEPTTTYSAWNKAANATDKFDKTDKGFYMANAPLFKNNSVTTLVAIDNSKIFPTEAQASSGEAAADIYVERGLAKVTLTEDTKAEKTVGDGSSYAGDVVTINNWALDVTNKKTFPIHNVDGLSTDYENIWKNDETATAAPSTQRFVDNSKATAKRVYWGTDPNYKETNLSAETPESKKAREDNFNYIKKENLTAKPTDPLYCLENTFNVANMLQEQTTRVVFKGTYTPKSITADANGTFYKIGKNVALWNSEDLKKHIVAAVTKVVDGASAAGTTIDVDLDATDNKLTVAGNRLLDKKNISVNGIELTQPQVDAVNEKLGLSKGYGISTYEKGESYYIARIKHFGDALTPWNPGEAYNGDNLKYLGRYGMLRNNWYELNVQSVSGPGYPDVPDVKPNTPDDEIDKYIKVSVKILSWAKRSQDVNL
ncbi:MAG TPA: hypothetical protein DCL96_08220 [Prevotella sp.]|nr:hypothetical protein [Prevotella sp.]